MKSRKQEIARLRNLVGDAKDVRQAGRFSAAHIKWMVQVSEAFDTIFGPASRYAQSFAALTWSLTGTHALPRGTWDVNAEKDRINNESFLSDLEKALGLLQAGIERLQTDSGDVFVHVVDRDDAPLTRLVAQLKRFADGLSRIREDNNQGKDGTRSGYRLANEYDVQDALWLLIRPQFPDALSESPTPKTGLTWSRVDLWIPSESIAIEVKYARSMRDGKKIDTELKKDFIDYQSAGAQAVIALIVEAPTARGLEELDNLEHSVSVPQVRIVRVRL